MKVHLSNITHVTFKTWTFDLWDRSDVRERVVWVDTTKTKVKDKAGKLKEKETTFLEVPETRAAAVSRRLRRVSTSCCFFSRLQVRVKAQKSGDQRLQEVLYSTEAQTDRYFCSRGKDELPRTHKGLPATNSHEPPVPLALNWSGAPPCCLSSRGGRTDTDAGAAGDRGAGGTSGRRRRDAGAASGVRRKKRREGKSVQDASLHLFQDSK